MSDDDKTVFEPAKPRQTGDMQIGDVLNGIYKITRFVAKGGMGSVYEAVNVHPPQERVAVKLMLPQFAADETMMAMFAREAETLTRLHHEAIVQYRLAARDMDQGRPFIVTEFVDGPSLEGKLGTLELTDKQFQTLAIKLARGLGAAHRLGAIHRDIAPDNILLAGGDPGHPKIIDFGIARDSREGENTGTIVGDGFAGKMKYVTPEQLGEYDRNIGPWSDVYSLALTLLAVASGKHADMGGSIADAMRKRQVVPDISTIPQRFHDAFARALQPDPAERTQSMEDFIEDLEGKPKPLPGGFAPIDEPAIVNPLKPDEEPKKKSKTGVIAGVLAGIIVLGGVAIGGYYFLQPGTSDTDRVVDQQSDDRPSTIDQAEVTEPSTGSVDARPSGNDVEPRPTSDTVMGNRGFNDLAASLANEQACSWLQYDGYRNGEAVFSGFSGTYSSMSSSIRRALSQYSGDVVTTRFDGVIRIDPSLCGPMDAIMEVSSGKTSLRIDNKVNEASVDANLSRDSSRTIRIVRIGMEINNLEASDDIALLDISAKGEIATVVNGRATLDYYVRNNFAEKIPAGYKFEIPTEFTGSGVQNSAVVLIRGQGPFSEDIVGQAFVEGSDASVNESWPRRFLQQARAKGWETDIVWYKLVDEVPG